MILFVSVYGHVCGAARHVAGTHAAARTLKAGKRPYTLVATLHANTVDLSIKKLKCTVPQHPDVRRFRTFWFCQTATVLPSPFSHRTPLAPAPCTVLAVRTAVLDVDLERRGARTSLTGFFWCNVHPLRDLACPVSCASFVRASLSVLQVQRRLSG